MSPLDVLIWLGVVVAAIFALSLVAVLFTVVVGAVLSVRKMREQDDAEQLIYKGRADQ